MNDRTSPAPETTPGERRAIAALQRLAKTWPKTLWLFAGDGARISIMKVDERGKRVMTASGGTDPNYRVATAEIPNDGGDW
jgi:hypothetical protein